MKFCHTPALNKYNGRVSDPGGDYSDPDQTFEKKTKKFNHEWILNLDVQSGFGYEQLLKTGPISGSSSDHVFKKKPDADPQPCMKVER